MADIGFANVEVLSAANTKVLAINNTRVSLEKGYGLMTPIATFEVAVSDILNALDVQPINQWISCKDKMPEDNKSVLFVYVSENGVKSVHYGYHTTISGIYCGWSKTSGGWQYSDEDVTHWQPIPEPPKDGDTNG